MNDDGNDPETARDRTSKPNGPFVPGESPAISRSSTPEHPDIRILAGFASLAIAGLLISAGILVRGPGDVLRSPASDPAGFASIVTSTAFTVWMLTTVASIPLRMYGFLALYAYLVDTDVERLSLVAVLLSLTSLVLFAHVLGVPDFVWPEIGRLYQAGQEEPFQLAGFPGASRILFLVATLVGLIGLLLFGIAVSHSDLYHRYLRWSGVPFGAIGIAAGTVALLQGIPTEPAGMRDGVVLIALFGWFLMVGVSMWRANNPAAETDSNP